MKEKERKKYKLSVCVCVCVCVCMCKRARSHNFKQSLATRSSDVAGSPASEPERAMIDAGASG